MMSAGHIDLENHEALFAVGDIHGDMFALLQVLKLTECVQIDPVHFHKSSRCWTNQTYAGDLQLKKRASLNAIDKTITWTGGSRVILFLGDILDNRRGSDQPSEGMCSLPNTQFQILDILVHLKQQARIENGDIVWVLGNHDVWNVSPVAPTCHRYGAATQQCDNEKFCTDRTVYSACDERGFFSKRHRDNVRNYMKAMDVVALCRITTTGKEGKTHVLALHGGLTDIPALLRDVGLRGGGGKDNIDAVNTLYNSAIFEHDQKAFSVIEKEYMPTWCRPKHVENANDLVTYFGTARMLKGHDVQRLRGGGRANCNVGSKPTGMFKANEHSTGRKIMEDGELCRMDVGMSRAFELGGSTKEFACVRLTSTDGRMYRQLFRIVEEINADNEYPRYSVELE